MFIVNDIYDVNFECIRKPMFEPLGSKEGEVKMVEVGAETRKLGQKCMREGDSLS